MGAGAKASAPFYASLSLPDLVCILWFGLDAFTHLVIEGALYPDPVDKYGCKLKHGVTCRAEQNFCPTLLTRLHRFLPFPGSYLAIALGDTALKSKNPFAMIWSAARTARTARFSLSLPSSTGSCLFIVRR